MTEIQFELLQHLLMEILAQLGRIAEATEGVNGQIQSLEDRLNVIEERTR